MLKRRSRSASGVPADEWVVCVKRFVAEGGRLVARLGEEMRDDDRRVELCPNAFVPVGTLRSEWPQPRDDLS